MEPYPFVPLVYDRPDPAAQLEALLGRPAHERPFCVIPVGCSADDCTVPDLRRKPLDEILVLC